MKTGRDYKFWFCTGSQDLYGDECLRKVAEHSKIIVEELNKSGVLPFEVVWKPTLITNELIRKHVFLDFFCLPFPRSLPVPVRSRTLSGTVFLI